MEKTIEVKGLRKSFNDTEVLKGVYLYLFGWDVP